MEGTSVTFSKKVDDIEEPILLPEEWYSFELIQNPEIKPNAAMNSDPEGEKAGHNWVVTLRTIECEDPSFNGRRFVLFFGIPKEADNENYTNDGQKIYDAKMKNIVEFASAFGGDVMEDTVELHAGAKGMCYVLQGLHRTSGEPENSIDIFQAGFKPCGGSVYGGAEGGEVEEIHEPPSNEF